MRALKGIWKVHAEDENVIESWEEDETIDMFLCPCGSGAMDIEKFGVFHRCHCHDCGLVFYVGWDEHSLEFIRADIKNPAPPQTIMEDTTSGWYCAEHGALKRTLLQVDEHDLTCTVLCPICRKPALPMLDEETEWEKRC